MKLTQLFIFKLILIGTFSSQLSAQPSSLFQVFPHGVASGDPLEKQVILWTRVNVPDSLLANNIEILIRIGEDSSMTNVSQTHRFTTELESDFTVKIDIKDLSPASIYFYQFESLGQKSPIGRTQTAGLKIGKETLRFGVVSCNNYEHGYFSAFRRLSEKPDLDAIIHLGDYIYEYYGRSSKLKDRRHFPPRELLSLSDYRLRYGQYRKDPDLQELHRLYPFITVWDDHEAANNAHAKGASAHDSSTEGDWEKRLEAAKKAYFEWMPIRNYPEKKVYRKISYGNLADLMMLDTRLEGREAQIYNVEDSSIWASDRSMLGAEQRDWLLTSLAESKAKWKLIGNQVIFAPIYTRHMDERVQNALMDIWNGYPAERAKITQFIQKKGIDNVVILTGDFHTSMALDVVPEDWPQIDSELSYNPKTGENAVAVEFATPSITSNNFDEFAKTIQMIRMLGLGKLSAGYISRKLMKDAKKDSNMPDGKQWMNPHIRYADLTEHGYLILSVSAEKAQADYYHIKNRNKKESPEKKVMSLFSGDGENRIQKVR